MCGERSVELYVIVCVVQVWTCRLLCVGRDVWISRVLCVGRQV